MVTASFLLAAALAADPQPTPSASLAPTPKPLVVEPHDSAFSIYLDEDTFQMHSTDRDYTLGLQLTFSGSWVTERHFEAPLRFFDRIFHVENLHAGRLDRGIVSHSVSFGDSAFTPAKEVLGHTEPIYDDRPYANIFFGLVSRKTFRYHSAVTSELTAGLLGLRVAQAVQTWIHTHKHPPDTIPGGWSHQISNGGEPTLRYRSAFQYLVYPPRVVPRSGRASPDHAARLGGIVDDEGLDAFERDSETSGVAGLTLNGRRRVDVVSDFEGNLGYYSNLGGGLKLRLALPWTHLRSSPFGDRLAINTTKAVQSPKIDAAAKRPFEFYIWGGVGGNVWLYNALFEGQFRTSDASVGFSPQPPSRLTLNRLTYDAQVGLTLSASRFTFAYVYSLHGHLYEGPSPRGHSWGGLYATIAR